MSPLRLGRDIYKGTPLGYAFELRSKDMIRLLLSAIPRAQYHRLERYVWLTADDDDNELLRRLLGMGVDPNSRHGSPYLARAVGAALPNSVRHLIERTAPAMYV